MSVPSNITTGLANLQAQVTAAKPLSSASQATLLAIQLNGIQLANDIATALLAAAGALDTWTAPSDPAQIAAGVLSLMSAATDQSALANMVGYVGRANKNLDQLAP